MTNIVDNLISKITLFKKILIIYTTTRPERVAATAVKDKRMIIGKVILLV